MTDTDHNTGKPVATAPVAKAAVAAPAVKAKAPKSPTPKSPTPKITAAKTAAPKTVAPKTVAPALAAAVPELSKPAPKAAKAPAAKTIAAPKATVPVKAAAPAAEPAKKIVEKSLAPVAPVVAAAAAVVPEKLLSKPVVEAPVPSSAPAKASKLPPVPQFMVPYMSTQTFKGYEDFTAFGKANLEAFVQANTLFAKGIEELSKEVVSLAQSSLESSTAATKAIFAAKTLKDVVELQADFAKTSFEKLVANSTKLGELTVKIATDSAAPIGARVTATAKGVQPAA
jgi:phasin family protein